MPPISINWNSINVEFFNFKKKFKILHLQKKKKIKLVAIYLLSQPELSKIDNIFSLLKDKQASISNFNFMTDFNEELILFFHINNSI